MNAKITLLLIGLGVAATAQADVVLSDSFSYADGDVAAAAGSPWLIHSGTTAANVQSGELRLTGGNSADVNALLSGGPYLSNSPAVLYSSFKMRVINRPGAAGTYFAHFKDTNINQFSGFGARVWVSYTNAYTGQLLTNTSQTSQYRVGIGNGTLAGSGTGQIDQDLYLNTNYTIVTRFVPNTGEATIWLNPSAESDPGVTATDAGTATRPNPIDVVAYAFRQASGIGTVLVDDLKVGTSFADVAGPNNPPSITGIAKQSIPANGSAAGIPFTISDVETPVGALSLAGSSSNTGLVPDANITFAGSGASRTVTVTPLPGQQGIATITISVTDEGGISASTSFQLAVGVPSISNIPNQSTPVDTTLGPLAFTIGDTETPVGSLTVIATSGNQSLIADGSIIIGGSGANRTMAITPSAGQAGAAVITVSVDDGINTATDTFVVTVNPLLGLLRSDDFNRPDGPVVQLDGLWLSNGGTGGTHLQEMQIVGGQAQISEDQSEDVSTELPPLQATVPVYSPSGGTIFYVGMKMTVSRLPSAGGSYLAHFRDGGNGFRARVFVATSGAAAGHYRVGIVNGAATVGPAGLVPVDLRPNEPHSLVLRYNVATAESRLWLDPSSEASPSLDASDSAQTQEIHAFTFRQNGGLGVVLVDDLKIGTAYSDVAETRYALTILGVGDDVQISWPKAARDAGYKLEENPGLDPAGWSDVSTDLISEQGDRLVVRFFDVTGNRFFRLIR